MQWERWIQQLQRVLSFAGGIAWGIVNKADSLLSDIETRPHSMLQSVLGTGDRHITAAENAEITALDGLAAGMTAKTGNATYAARTITGTADEITVTHGDGISGNPTLELPDRISTPRKFGTATDYTEFEADGTPVFIGDATNWNDINLGIGSLRAGASAPGTWTVPGTAIILASFNGSGPQQDAYGSLEILHDYKEGTDIVPHIHWCPTTTAAGNIVWQLEYAWTNGGGTVTASTTITVTVATTLTVANEIRSNFPAISGAGKTMGSRFIFHLFRNAAHVDDTYTDPAGAFDFGVHYERDTIGSRGITTK